MRKAWKRLVFAASLSCVGFLGTYTWYSTTEKKLTFNSATPVAQVSEVGEEVLRRPSTRLLWHNVNTGDQLYSGEAIRTSPTSEVRIQFEDGKFIDLESDSLIILQKNKGEIALDLMEGSLFVNANVDENKDSTAIVSNLVLNSASGKVELNGSSSSLSKSLNGKMDLQVLEGKAKIQSADGQTKELSEGSGGALDSQGLTVQNVNLKIISPVTNGKQLVDPSLEKPVSFQWQGLPKEWNVSVFAGTNRKDLKELANAAPSTSKVDAQLTLGKHFWKLVAIDPKTNKVVMESSVYKMDLIARSIPTIIFPTSGAKLEYESSDYTMAFKWQKSPETKQIVVEVAKDSSLKNKIFSKNFNDEESFEVPNFKDGEYYWRIVAFYSPNEKPLLGKVQKFIVVKKATIQKPALQSEWDLKKNSDVQFFTNQPSINLAWLVKNRLDEVHQYKVKISDEAASANSVQNFSITDTNLQVPVTHIGRYTVTLEIVDQAGEKIGELPTRTIAVSEYPPLPAPKIFGDGEVLRSGDNGKSQLKWEKIEGAVSYQLTLANSTGKVIVDKQFRSPAAVLTNMPGEYKVQVVAIDSHGRVGEKVEPRKLIVPDKSNLKAPTLKGIKVK